MITYPKLNDPYAVPQIDFEFSGIAGKVPDSEKVKNEITALNEPISISGATPVIVAKTGKRYICGEITSLSFTPCETGICNVRFTSGSTPTAITLPYTVKMPEWWIGAEANKVYEISIADGIYGAVMSWD